MRFEKEKKEKKKKEAGLSVNGRLSRESKNKVKKANWNTNTEEGKNIENEFEEKNQYFSGGKHENVRGLMMHVRS